MKREYVRPTAIVETFTANEYVAVCGMVDGKYVFTCDAPRGTVYYYDKSTGSKKKLGGYHPCGDKHITDGTSEYYDGFVDYNGNGVEDSGEGKLIWREKNRYGQYVDYHASASLTRDKIDVPRS